MSWADMARYRVALPPEAISDALSQRCQLSVRAIQRNASESRVLTEVRDGLLPRLVSGEIRLQEAEKVVEGR